MCVKGPSAKDSPLFLLAEFSGAWVTMLIKDTGEFTGCLFLFHFHGFSNCDLIKEEEVQHGGMSSNCG